MKAHPPIAVLASFAGAATFLSPAASGATDTLANRPAPAGLRAIAGAAGGRILDGTVRGAAAQSPAAVLRAGLHLAGKFFDAPPAVLAAVRSTDGTMTLALFKASLARAPVGGYVLTTYVAHGDSRVDVLFDRTERAGRTLAPLLSQVATLRSPVAGRTPAAAMHDIVSPDGTVRAQLPDGWHPTVFGQGEFAAVNAVHDEVDQEISVAVNDPNGAAVRQQSALSATGVRITSPYVVVPYTPEPARAYTAVMAALVQRGLVPPQQVTITHVAPGPSQNGAASAELIGSSVRGGTTFRFDAKVLVSPLNPYGGWTLSLKQIAAPAARYERDLPTMLAVFKSYTVDQRVRGDQVAASIAADREGMARIRAQSETVMAQNTAVFNASMSHARSVQAGIDRSTSGFVHYLSDTTVVERAGGGRASVNANFAQRLVEANPDLRIVPVAEYRSGD